MSRFLEHVGRFSARHRLVVIGAWLLILVALGGALGGAIAAKVDPGPASTSIPDTPATQALERMEEHFPATSGGEQGDTLQFVFQAHDGGDITDPAIAAAVQGVLADADRIPGLVSVSDPFDAARPYISPDGSTAVATLTFDALDAEQQVTAYDAALDLRADAPDSLSVEVGGALVPLGAPERGPGEIIGIIAAFVVLLVTFGSLRAAGANLVVALVGVGIGVVGVLAVGAFVPMGDTALILASMLGLAVGIDYSLFVLSRYRTELRAGRSVEDAVARATATAGTAVVFAGLTVIIALAGLLVANISFITEMGMAAAAAVAVAVLLALTLLPALMRSLGYAALSHKDRKLIAAGVFVEPGAMQPAGRVGVLRRWAMFVVKRPLVSITAGVAVLVLTALPMLQMKTAFNIPGGADPEATERVAYNLILDEFGGVQSPLIVLAEGEDVAGSTAQLERQLQALEGVQQVLPAEVSADGDAARLTVIPSGGPIDDETKDLVHAIRDGSAAAPGVELSVTGEAAIGIDQDAALMEALIKYIIVIVAISLVLLIVMFRSLLVPLVATLGYLLSVGASFGASVAVFQWGWLDFLVAAPQGDPMLSILPLLLVGVLFGLAMDYQVFLVSRIKEMHDSGMAPKQAIIEGFSRSAPVLVAAATIMTVVFAGFATSTFAIAASIAFGLAVGVFADAFIVRLILMPAVLSLVGKAAWWMPGWLERIVPRIDTEGHALAETPGQADREPELVTR
ncbi:MAG TPA: MMPL family transporter [Rhodoglobus sp.]|nr:MMPL family transporter [Rhodoglobus sp.]